MSHHPLLVNPAKYLSGSKRHAIKFYRKGNYDSKSLNLDPFANILRETKLDGQRVRFPKGDMIQLVVDRINDKLTLAPVSKHLPKDTALITSHYLLNHMFYVGYVENSKLWRKYIPQKFKFKNNQRLVREVQLLPYFKESVAYEYENRIKVLLTNVEETREVNKYIHLVNDGSTLKFEGGNPIININSISKSVVVDKPIKVSFENDALCLEIIRLLNYRWDIQ